MIVIIFHYHWIWYMSRKVYLIELEGFWPGVRRNIIQLKWYLAFASTMSMFRNFVLTKFPIYLNLQSCSCPQIKSRAFSVLSFVICHFLFCHSGVFINSSQEILITCGLIENSAMTLPKNYHKRYYKILSIGWEASLNKFRKDIFNALKVNWVESSLSDLFFLTESCRNWSNSYETFAMMMLKLFLYKAI